MDAEIAEARQKRDRIAEMFTEGIVTADNMEYWNGEMKRHADALAKAEAARSTFKSEAQSDEPPEGFFEEFVASLTQWSKGLELNPDDDALKRLLVGMMVQDVICNLVISILINVEGKNSRKKPGTLRLRA